MDRADIGRTAVVNQNITPLRRISWGAVIAGTVVAIAVGIALSFLGFAIGFGAMDPTDEQFRLSGFGIGAAIWWVVTSLIALFIGSWFAGRLSTVRMKLDGMLNGVLVWGLSTIVLIFLLTSAVGTIIGGAFGIARTGISAAASAAAPVISSALQGTMQNGASWDEITKEARSVLRQTGKPGLHPDTLLQSDGDLISSLDQLLRQAGDAASEVDKEAVVNVLVARTDMSRQEASQRVDQWIQMYQGAAEKAGELAEGARETARDTANAISRASAWSFVMLLLGAGAAALGGYIGTNPPSTPAAESQAETLDRAAA